MAGFPDLVRVVEVLCRPPEGRIDPYAHGGQPPEAPERSTGYLISPNIVLTALHAVREAAQRPAWVRVRQASRHSNDDWISVRTVVEPSRRRIEVALLVLAEDVPVDTAMPGFIDLSVPLPFYACGFPAVHRRKEERDTETARGLIRPDSRSRTPILVLDIQSPAPVDMPVHTRGDALAGSEESRRSGWSGLSGAAVITGPGRLLVGIVSTTDRQFAGDRLYAAPVSELLADESLAAHLPSSWRASALPRVSNYVRLGLGDRRMQLASPRSARMPTDLVLPRITALLDAKSQVVPFIPRAEPQQRLRKWCLDDLRPVSYAVLSGAGGSGKSRLASQLCADVAAAGWVSGTAQEPTDSAATIVALQDVGRPLLIVLDYADHQQAEVAELLKVAATAVGPKIRILAVVRDGDAFLRRLAVELRNYADEFGEDRHIALAGSVLTMEEREQHYRAAAKAFSARITKKLPGSLPDPDPDPDPDELERRLAAMTTPLLVHARALLDTLEYGAPHATDGAADAADVLEALLVREDDKFWKEDFSGLIEYPHARREVCAVSTLAGAHTQEEALNALDAAGITPETRRSDVVERMRHLHSRLLPVVEPDLLGEQLIASSVIEPGRLAAVFDKANSPRQRSRSLEVLLRMCGSPVGEIGQTTVQALTAVVGHRLGELVAQSIEVTAVGAMADQDAAQLPARLASCLELVRIPSAAALVAATTTFPERTSLQTLSAAIYRSAAEDAAARLDYTAAASLEVNAASALTRAGRLHDAQSPIDQAMTYLASTPSYAGSQALARVLSAGSMVNIGLSRPGAGLLDAQRAVEIVEANAAREPGSHDKQLFETRQSLAIAYLASGQPAKASAIVERALADGAAVGARARGQMRYLQSISYQGMGNLDTAVKALQAGIDESTADGLTLGRELPGMHMCLATLQATLGRIDEARKAAETAMRIAEEQFASGGDESTFVLSQIRLGAATIVGLTDQEYAFVLADQASETLFGLYHQSPDAYGPYYLAGEALYAMALTATGQHDAARSAATRAANVARKGFSAQPSVYLQGLLTSAVALANSHAAIEDFASAGRVITQTHDLVDRLDESIAPYAPTFSAQLLTFLADIQLADDDLAAATDTAKRAVAALDRLAEKSASGHLSLLIGARLLLMKALATADRAEDYVAEGELALINANSLLEIAPSDYSRRILALTRYLVAGGYSEQGDKAAAISLLQRTLDEFTLDQETRSAEEDRDFFLDAIRSLEAAQQHGRDDSAPPTQFSDLTPGPHRVVLGLFRNSEVAARAYRPVLIMGPQRSRKTTALITPTLLEWDGPALVTSVRSDVVLGTIARRKRMGKVWVFEPFRELFSGGTALTTWNPLDECREWERAVRMAHALTESGRGVPGQSGIRDEAFWYEQAALLLGPLLHAAALSGLTMNEVSRWVRAETRAEVRARLLLAPEREATDIFKGITETMAEVTRSGVYATLRVVLRAYESAAVRDSSATGFSPTEFFSGPNTLYLCAPPEEQERLTPIFTALVRTVLTHAYRFQRDELNLLLLLDEAGNIARIEDLDTIATTAAGTGIQLVTAFHDMSQLQAVYGYDKANSIANNHSATIFLPGNRDPATMDLVDRIFKDESGRGLSRRSVRQLTPGTGLCVYDHLPIEEIKLRSATHDEDLIRYAAADTSEEEISLLVVQNRRR